MPRRIRIEIDGAVGVAELCEELSPRMTEALWRTLPIDAILAPAKWSGNACFLMPGGEHLRAVGENENAVCSIYPGYLVARPGGSELLIAYGQSEYRWAPGTDYVTRLARVLEGGTGLLAMLARTHDEGDKHIRITRDE